MRYLASNREYLNKPPQPVYPTGRKILEAKPLVSNINMSIPNFRPGQASGPGTEAMKMGCCFNWLIKLWLQPG